MISSMADFESQVLNSAEPVLVDFYAEWCAPCKSLDSVLGTIKNVRIVKVNVHKADAVAGAYMVNMLPTTLMFNGGRVTGALKGLHKRERYLELINGEICG
jgi:thioredoxin 1